MFQENPFMDTAAIISTNLTAWMAATPGLDTLQKLEARSGVGFGTIRRAKNGDGNITVDKLTAIAAAFGRLPAELMTPAPTEGGEALLPATQATNPAGLDEMSVEARAKILVELAGEVSLLWMSLPPDRRTTMLQQLREETGRQAGAGRIIPNHSRNPARATNPDIKERREAD